MLVRKFLEGLDSVWAERSAKIELKVIGSTALMLQADYERGTKDSDVLETEALDPETQKRLLALAGQGIALHRRHRLYLDIVGNGVPFSFASNRQRRNFDTV